MFSPDSQTPKGRSQWIGWINLLTDASYPTLEALSDCILYCQVLEMVMGRNGPVVLDKLISFDCTLPISRNQQRRKGVAKEKYSSNMRTDIDDGEECHANAKFFEELAISPCLPPCNRMQINVQRVLSRNTSAHIEVLEWLYKLVNEAAQLQKLRWVVDAEKRRQLAAGTKSMSTMTMPAGDKMRWTPSGVWKVRSSLLEEFLSVEDKQVTLQDLQPSKTESDLAEVVSPTHPSLPEGKIQSSPLLYGQSQTLDECFAFSPSSSFISDSSELNSPLSQSSENVGSIESMRHWPITSTTQLSIIEEPMTSKFITSPISVRSYHSDIHQDQKESQCSVSPTPPEESAVVHHMTAKMRTSFVEVMTAFQKQHRRGPVQKVWAKRLELPRPSEQELHQQVRNAATRRESEIRLQQRRVTCDGKDVNARLNELEAVLLRRKMMLAPMEEYWSIIGKQRARQVAKTMVTLKDASSLLASQESLSVNLREMLLSSVALFSGDAETCQKAFQSLTPQTKRRFESSESTES